MKSTLQLTGIHYRTFATCHRQLWYYAHHIRYEKSNNFVLDGIVEHDNTYKRRIKEVKLGLNGVVDWLELSRSKRIIHEFKRGSKFAPGDRLQLLFYCHWFLNSNVEIVEGHLHYLNSKKIHILYPDVQTEKEINDATIEIYRIINGTVPPLRKLPICSGCSQFEICWGGIY